MDNKAVKKIVSYLLLTSVFISGGGIAHIGFTIEWFHFVYVPFAIACLFIFHRFSYRLLITLALLVIGALITFQYGLPLVIKQLVNIGFVFFVFYNFLKWENFNYEKIFRKYATLCKIVLIIGFIQVFLFALEPLGLPAHKIYLSVFPFLKTSNISVRYQSVTQEPSFLAYAFAPIVFLALFNLFNRPTHIMRRRWSPFFVMAYLLTFSLVAYVGLLLMLLVLYFRNFTVGKLSLSLFFFVFIMLFCFVIYKTVPEVKLRADDTWYSFTSDVTDPEVYEKVNLTTYALVSNWYVTRHSMADQPLLGTGLGTYELTYDRYIPFDMADYSNLNREDAGSLAMRIITETGFIGFFIFMYFLLRYRLRALPSFDFHQELNWIINAGIFVLIVLFLIRTGNYTAQAKPLFFLLYFYTYKAARTNE